MLVLIDNYDSFTYNLFHALGRLGEIPRVVRNDRITAEALRDPAIRGLVLSPGPATPDQAGICLEAVAIAAERRLPLLGVCLGHQAIGQAFGGRVIRAQAPMHGKTDPIRHDGRDLFQGLDNPLTVTRYHSLIVEAASLPACLEAQAWAGDSTIMGLRHQTLPIFGVQFHPESIATHQGERLLQNFLNVLTPAAPASAAA